MIYRIWNCILGVKEDIENNIIHYIVILVQIIALCFFTYYLSNSISNYNKVKNIMNKVNSKGNMYILYNNSDNSDDEKIYNNRINEYFEIYEYINSKNNLEYYIVDSSQNHRIGEKNISVSEKFLDIFDIDKSFGNEDDLETVIIGNNLKKYYSVGDYIKDYSNNKEYLVTDIMDKGTCYVSPREDAHPIYLDDYVLFKYDENYVYNSKDRYSIIDFFNNITFITEDKSVMQDIVKKSVELDLYKYELQDYEYRKQLMLDTLYEATQNDVFVIVILIVFVVINSMSFIIQYIANNRRTFAIYMISGSSKFEIVMRIALKYMAVIAIGIILCALKKGVSEYIYYLIIGFSIYMALILIYPIVEINRMSVGNLLRRNNE